MSKKSEPVHIPRGAIFTVTTGVYSDYMVDGVFRAVDDIDPERLLEEWLMLHPDERKDYNFDAVSFLASLTHVIEPIDCFEWHLEDYRSVSEMWVGKVNDNEND